LKNINFRKFDFPSVFIDALKEIPSKVFVIRTQTIRGSYKLSMHAKTTFPVRINRNLVP
jgi:hypothetical protein